jgi:hypothetical protein
VKTIQTSRLVLFSLVAGLCSCAVTSKEYVEGLAGYSVTEGRITRIAGLQTETLEPLEDGLAVTVSQPGGKVWILFDSGESRTFELDRGVILVHGYESDFMLRSALRTIGVQPTPVEPTGVPSTRVPSTNPSIDLPQLPSPTGPDRSGHSDHTHKSGKDL